MKRGEVWTLRDEAYASKARPAVVIQGDEMTGFDSVILCLVTTYDSSGIPTRVPVKPDEDNGLEKQSYVMTEKIVTVNEKLLGRCIGKLDENAMKAVSCQLVAVLGLNQ